MLLTDQQWTIVQPLLPPPPASQRGRPPLDQRLILQAILWKLATHTPWYDLPSSFPSHQTCYRHYRRWRRLGVMGAVLSSLYRDLQERGGFDLGHAFQDGRIRLRRQDYHWCLEPDPSLQATWQLSTAMIFAWMAVKNLSGTAF